MREENKGQKKKLIVLYDGECRFCTITKNMAEKNTENTYTFVSYHSPEGKKLSDTFNLRPEKTIYLFDDNAIRDKSDASLAILKNMRWWGYVLGSIGSLFPKTFSDFVYDAVAKHRR